MVHPRRGPASRDTGAARADAILHTAKFFAVLRAGIADIGAQLAQAGMKLALARQRVSGGDAEGRTIQHQAQMLRPCMFTAHFNAMGHGSPQACSMAAHQMTDAIFDLGAEGGHGANLSQDEGERSNHAGCSTGNTS